MKLFDYDTNVLYNITLVVLKSSNVDDQQMLEAL
jgi:hypothetical protein